MWPAAWRPQRRKRARIWVLVAVALPSQAFLAAVAVSGFKACFKVGFFNLDCELKLNLLALFKVLKEFAFQISWRTEEVLYRLDVGWPKHSEYFTGATFCVAVDSLNGLVYVAQVSHFVIFFQIHEHRRSINLFYCTKLPYVFVTPVMEFVF